MRASPAKNPFHGVPVLSLAVLRCRHLLDGGDNQALVGVLGAAAGTGRIAATADEGLVRFEKTVQRVGRVLAQPVAQLVRHRPRRLVGHPQFPLQKLGCDAALFAAHQVGGDKPLRQIGAGSMKHGSRRHRFLPVAGGAFIDPRPRLQPPRHPPAAPGADKPTRPAKPPGAQCTAPPPRTARQTPAAQPSDRPLIDRRYATMRRGPMPEHLENLSCPDRETPATTDFSPIARCFSPPMASRNGSIHTR
jgi:hypothetical protein